MAFHSTLKHSFGPLKGWFACLVICLGMLLQACADIRQETLRNIANQTDEVDFYLVESESFRGIKGVYRKVEDRELALWWVSQLKDTIRYRGVDDYQMKVGFFQPDHSLTQFYINLDDTCRCIHYRTIDRGYLSPITPEIDSLLKVKRGELEREAAPRKALEELDWLLGNWVQEKNGKSLIERWEKGSDSLFTGGDWMVEEGDSVQVESLQLRVRDGKLEYVADVQENPDPVPFALIDSGEDFAIFENPHHDWPQVIRYESRYSGAQLKVRVSGFEDGDYRELKFNFVKRDPPVPSRQN